MRRRTFILRLGVAGAGTLAFGACNGRLYTDRDGPRPRLASDGGAAPSDGGANHTDAGTPRPPGPYDAGPGTPPSGSDAGRPPDPGRDAGAPRVDAGPCPGGSPRTVTLHDTHAQALYFDGSYGPTTGVITVDQIVRGATLELEFWHGHGGSIHRFTVGSADLAQLARGERVTLTTTEVDGHAHMLFIDPVQEQWRVAGAADRTVVVC